MYTGIQGDSGGPLYVLEEGKRAVLVGIVNRGEGCARKNAMGIYARSRIFIFLKITILLSFLAKMELQFLFIIGCRG